MVDLSIVIPVYNSEGCLGELYSQLRENIKLEWEVIFINDYSSDNSWKVIRELSESYDGVIGINFRRNSGQDNAIMAGLHQAKGGYVVIMDDDLQHSPKDIEKLHHKCLEGFDVCFANFLIKKQKLWKNIGSWINGKFGQWLLNKPKSIYLSPFKIIHSDLVKEVTTYDGPYPYVDGLLLAYSNNLTQVDVEHAERYEGESTYSFIKSVTVWIRHMTGFSVLPLRVATLVGTITAVGGSLLGIYFIIVHITAGRVVEGWTTLVVLLLFFGGLILMALGIIGEYVGRSYLLLNRKPQYSIREIVGNE